MSELFELGSALGGLFQSGANIAINAMNRKDQKEAFEWQKQQTAWQNQFAKDQFEYQKYMNQITMNRQDTEIQRRYKDLQQAGINPLTAVGTGGASSGGMSTGAYSGGSGNATAPQMAGIQGLDNIAQGVMNILTQKQNISQSREQEKYIQEQTRTEREKQKNLKAATGKTERETQYYDDLTSKAQAEIDAIEKENELRELRKETEKAKAYDTWQSGYNKYWDRSLGQSSATKTHEKSYYSALDGSMFVQGGGMLGNSMDQLFRNIWNAITK